MGRVSLSRPTVSDSTVVLIRSGMFDIPLIRANSPWLKRRFHPNQAIHTTGQTRACGEMCLTGSCGAVSSFTALTTAIMDGGVVLNSEVPANTVGSVLNRQAKIAGAEIISVSRGVWGLAVWYPNPGRFTKRREIEKGEGDPPPPARSAETPAAPSPPFRNIAIPPGAAIPLSVTGLFREDAVRASEPPKGGNLDDEVPF